MGRSSKQKAGKNSNLINAETINIGLTEERVREIIKTEKKAILKELELVSKKEADERLDRYTDILLPKLVKAEVLDSFNNPAIQMLYKKSERTAVCTTETKDYEMLSELLIHRVENNGDITISTAISKAIEEVNNVSDEALRTLSLIYSIISFVPVTGDIFKALEIIDDHYKNIIDDYELPIDDEWLENLELVRAVRIDDSSGKKELKDFFLEKFKMLFTLGIRKGSPNYDKAIELLKKTNFGEKVLIENLLDNNYVRLNYSHKGVDSIIIDYSLTEREIFILSEEDKNILNSITDIYETNRDFVKGKFNEIISNYENICKVIEWWDGNLLNKGFTITKIGMVLAHTNLKRIDSRVPDLIK